MNRTLVISDIHANLSAFEAVLHNAANKYDQVLFLGDIANFGPNPIECVNLLRDIKAICVQGNHDLLIAQEKAKRNFWDEWSREQLTSEQLKWMLSWPHKMNFDNSILVLHGSYDVEYDILPNIPNTLLENAFKGIREKQTKKIWFGHYHYDINIEFNEIEYTCIRPVGHHRDKDTRASYYIYENKCLVQHKIEYDIERTIYDTCCLDILDEEFKQKWRSLLENGYHEEILYKDITKIKEYEKMRGILC